MQYREVQHTINVNGRNGDLPVDIDGEIEVRQTDIATDADTAAGDVHAIASELESAIHDILEDHREDDDER